jgi:hypothetical protein
VWAQCAELVLVKVWKCCLKIRKSPNSQLSNPPIRQSDHGSLLSDCKGVDLSGIQC